MTKPKQDTDIIRVTAEDLKAYADAKNSNKTTAKDFCQYLKDERHSKAKEVIADLSGIIFANISLNNIDLGNIIAGEIDGKYTKFQNCNLAGEYTKLRSNAPMKGLEFTNCKMGQASFIADLNGVNFGEGSDISYLNLKEAYNIDKCIINTDLCRNIEVGFPDHKTFKKHMEDKLAEQQKHQNPISHHKETTPDSPKVHVPVVHEPEEGVQFGIPALFGDAFKAVTSIITTVGTAAGSAAGTVFDTVTTNITVGGPKPVDAIKLHQSSIQKILRGGPAYSTAIKNIEPSNIHNLTSKEVVGWIEEYKDVEASNRMSLNELIRIKTDNDDIVPHLINLDLKHIDFSGLEFGDVVISGCDFTASKFNECNLDSVSARDCIFTDAEITNTSANHADLTRCVFKGTKIDKTQFIGAKLVDTDLSPSDLPTQISNTNFDHADMRSSNAHGAKVIYSTFNETNMESFAGDALMLFNVSADKANLSGAELTHLAARDTEITNSIAHDTNLDGASLDRVDITGTDAQKINLNNSDQKDVTYKDSDLSGGTANNSIFQDVTIDNSKIINFQTQQITARKKPYKPSLSTIQEEDEVSQAVISGLENLEITGERDERFMQGNTITSALERKEGQDHLGITIANVDARGKDYAGSHLKNHTFTNVDMSLSKWQNAVLDNCTFINCNLSRADLSNVKMINTTISDTNLTAANMQGIEVHGGKWQKVDISDADITYAKLGTNNSNLIMEDGKCNDVTNLAHTKVHVIDQRTSDQKALIELTDSDGQVTKQSPNTIAATCIHQEEIAGNQVTAALQIAASTANRTTQALSSGASAMANELKHKHKSRMGLVVGIIGGIVAGGIITGIAASTFGLGLIPLGIVAATTIGGGAIGGGIAGSFVQNTSKGKAFLAIATAGIAAMVIGPIGLVAAPVISLYNTITGKDSSARHALGSAISTLIANPLKKIAGFVASVAPLEPELIAAQEMRSRRDEVQIKTTQERTALESQNVTNVHSQSVDIAKQQTSNDQYMPVPELTQAKAKHQDSARGQDQSTKKSWGSKFKKAAYATIDKVTPKKKTSYVNTLSTTRTTGPATRGQGG